MTVPVEGHEDPAGMRFYVGGADRAKARDEAEVKVIELPDRTVASHGALGSYNRKNFHAALSRLNDWLKEHPEYDANSPLKKCVSLPTWLMPPPEARDRALQGLADTRGIAAAARMTQARP